jgi:hypothetical protein
MQNYMTNLSDSQWWAKIEKFFLPRKRKNQGGILNPESRKRDKGNNRDRRDEVSLSRRSRLSFLIEKKVLKKKKVYFCIS